jgi:hypothetical protein
MVLLSYTVPLTDGDVAQIFNVMERSKRQYGITEWGVTQASLEEVFVKVVTEWEDQAKRSVAAGAVGRYSCWPQWLTSSLAHGLDVRLGCQAVSVGRQHTTRIVQCMPYNHCTVDSDVTTRGWEQAARPLRRRCNVANIIARPRRCVAVTPLLGSRAQSPR